MRMVSGLLPVRERRRTLFFCVRGQVLKWLVNVKAEINGSKERRRLDQCIERASDRRVWRCTFSSVFGDRSLLRVKF